MLLPISGMKASHDDRVDRGGDEESYGPVDEGREGMFRGGTALPDSLDDIPFDLIPELGASLIFFGLELLE